MALATPSLAISCAAREALHQADVVETMLRGMLPVIRNNDLELAEKLRKMDDTVDELYSAIKFYLTQISREALSEREGRRWTDIVSFTINMEQIGDIIERVLQDVEDKKIRKNRSFSDAGMAEICHLHERLLANLRLGDERVPRRPCARRAQAAGGEGRASATSSTSTRQPHRAACRTTPRRASRPVRCTST